MGFDLQAHQELRRLSYQVNCLVRDFCCRAKKCIGISNTGDPNLVLNQQGNWVANNDSIQDLLSDLPEYLGAKEASEDGKPIGYWYYNTFYNNVAKVTEFINRYSAGVSPITFISDGSNGWDLSVIANPSTVQIPSGETIDSCHVELYFWDAGSRTDIYDNDITVDDVINSGANGAGLYEVLLTYNISDGSTFQVFGLYVVNATDSILHYYVSNGVTVNSVNGLVMDVSADIDQSGSIVNEWMQSDGGAPTSVRTGDDAVLTLLPTTVILGQQITLDSNFSDYPNPTYLVGFSVIIN